MKPTSNMQASLMDRLLAQVSLRRYRRAQKSGNPDAVNEAKLDIWNIVPNREMLRGKGFNVTHRTGSGIGRLRRPRSTPPSLETLVSIPLEKSDKRIIVPRDRVKGIRPPMEFTARSGKGKNPNKLKGKKTNVHPSA